jgi:ribosomal protein S1
MKRRVHRLRQNEQLEQEAEAAKIWRAKKKVDKPGASADINMVFFLPAEYWNQSDEKDQEEAAAHLVLQP